MGRRKKTNKTGLFAAVLVRSSFFQGFFIAGLFLCFCLTVLPARYETNDEFNNIMRLNPQGELGADAMNPYFSQTLWNFLAFSYGVAPEVPWYGLTLYLALFLALGLMVSLCVRQCDKLSLLILLPGCFLFSFHCAVFASFTAACLILELAVFLALLEWVITDSCPAKKPRMYGVLLLGCLLLSYSLRWRLFFFGIAFALPIALFVAKRHLRIVWPYLLILIAFIAADRLSFHLKNAPEDRAFMHYDTLRMYFHDTVKGTYHEDRTPQALEKAGWSLDDYVVFRRWILYDDTMFNENTVKVFVERNDPQKALSIIKLIPERIMENYLKSKYYTLLFSFTIVAFVVLKVINFRRMPSKELFQVVLSMAAVLAIILFFAYYRFVPRVYVPLYLYAVILCLVLVYRKVGSYATSTASARSARIIVMFVAVLTLCAYGTAYARLMEIRKTLSGSQKKKSYIVGCLNTVKLRETAGNPIMLLMDPSDSLCRESVHPLKEMDDYVNLMFMPAGTDINSPRYKRLLQTLEISSGRELLRWTVNNDRVLYAFCAVGRNSFDDYTGMWLRYLNRRISPEEKVGFRLAYDFRNKAGVGLVVFKAVSRGS